MGCGEHADQELIRRGYTGSVTSRKIVSLVAAVFLLAGLAAAQPTALDKYVEQRDPVYAWKLVTTLTGEGYKTYVLELTSQTMAQREGRRSAGLEALADRSRRPDQVALHQGAAVHRRRQQQRPGSVQAVGERHRIAMDTGYGGRRSRHGARTSRFTSPIRRSKRARKTTSSPTPA